MDNNICNRKRRNKLRLSCAKPNFKLRLGLTWILLFIPHHTTPHHPTRNSTSTRNKGPNGLKFCMRPHLTQLTTTQHNFNPTIIWVGVGRGGPGLTLPAFFLTKIFLDLNHFDQTFFCDQTFSLTIFFVTKNIFNLNYFL